MRIKLKSILLLFILVAPLLIPYCWLQYEKSIAQDEAERLIVEGIDNNDLVLIKFTKEESLTEVRWKHEGEFEYNQKMFDIVDRQIIGDTIYYSCWWDKEETIIMLQLAELGSKIFDYDPLKKEKQERLVSFFFPLYVSEGFNWSPIPLWKDNRQSFIYLVSFPSSFFQPQIPPPKVS